VTNERLERGNYYIVWHRFGKERERGGKNTTTRGKNKEGDQGKKQKKKKLTEKEKCRVGERVSKRRGGWGALLWKNFCTHSFKNQTWERAWGKIVKRKELSCHDFQNDKSGRRGQLNERGSAKGKNARI